MPRSSRLLTGAELAKRDAWARTRLDDLERSYSRCTQCRALVDTGWWQRQNIVFGEGYANADILIVGIAPGEDEDVLGIPFVGRTGKLLDEFLLNLCPDTAELDTYRKGALTNEDFREIRRILVETERIFYTNAVLCRPVKQEWNEREERNDLRNRDPADGECNNCSLRLLQTIYITDPTIIISLGAPALQALLSLDTARGRRRAGVLDKSGEILDLEIPGQVMDIRYPMMVLPHPAFLLRYWDEKSPKGYVASTVRHLRHALHVVDMVRYEMRGTLIPRR